MYQYSALRLWTPQSANMAVDEIRRRIDHLNTFKDDFSKHMTPAGWQGEAASAAAKTATKILSRLEELIDEMSAARTALKHAADDLGAFATRVQEVDSTAKFNSLWITDDGRVVDKMDRLDAESTEMLGYRAAVKGWLTEDVNKVHREARRIDSELARALRNVSNDKPNESADHSPSLSQRMEAVGSWLYDKTDTIRESVEYYGHYLFGEGQSKSVDIHKHSWPEMSIDSFVKDHDMAALNNALSQLGDGPHSTTSLSEDILRPESFAPTDYGGKGIIGNVTFHLEGTFVVRGDTWEFFGSATPDNDVYDFDIDSDRDIPRNASTAVGSFGGYLAEMRTLGIVDPMPYELTIEGAIPMRARGTLS